MAETALGPERRTGKRTILPLILLLVLMPLSAGADDIHLKDGQRLRTPRAWVEGDYAHFILEGTADVEIRYSLEIIDRIVSSDGKQLYPAITDTPGVAPQEKTIPTEPEAEAPKTVAPAKMPTQTEAIEPTTSSDPPIATIPVITSPIPAGVDTKLLRARAKKLRQVPFYDPRRKRKYWAASQSRHDDVKGAVAALAALFNQSPEWVTRHLGNTNDLGQIHLNLIRELENRQQPLAGGAGLAKEAAAPEAKKPRRPTSAETEKKGAEKAVNTAKPASPKKTVRASNPFAANLPDTEGPFFYNPRRPKKFWASETSRHDSLDDALNALADQYGRQVSWIESHMGASNSLEEIHRSLTQAIEAE